MLETVLSLDSNDLLSKYQGRILRADNIPDDFYNVDLQTREKIPIVQLQPTILNEENQPIEELTNNKRYFNDSMVSEMKEINQKSDLRIIGKSRSDFSNNLYTVKARNTTYDRPFNNLIQPYKTEHDDEWKNLTENETDRKETITFTPRWSDNGICQSTRENLTKGSIVAELINKGLEIEKNMKNVLKQTNEK